MLRRIEKQPQKAVSSSEAAFFVWACCGVRPLPFPFSSPSGGGVPTKSGQSDESDKSAVQTIRP
jgi:hypothetical protein